MRQKFILRGLFFLIAIVGGNVYSQHVIRIEGYVMDARSGEALDDVTVAVKGTTFGTATSGDGHFSFNATLSTQAADSAMLVVSYIGYNTFYAPLEKGLNKLNIKLEPVSYELNEVIVKPGRERYTKRDNPAVDFVRQIIARRNMNAPLDKDYFSYDTYEQRTFAYDNFDIEKARQNQLYNRIDFIFDYVDSTSVKGRTILPLYNEEIIEDFYYRRSPRTERKIVKAYKRAGLIEIISEEGVRQFIDESFQDVDIFRDNVPLLLKRFVSPLASFGPDYYKYYLLDTVSIDGERCMDLGFVPFNTESFGFVGHLYVTLDSTWFVKKVNLNVPRDINLNFISEMSIDQEYKRTADNVRILTKNDIVLIFRLSNKGYASYARRIALYRNHTFDEPTNKSVFDEKSPVVESADARRQNEAFWNEARKGASGFQKTSVDKMMAQLRDVPLFYWSEKIIDILVNGYIQTSKTNSLFEFGPANTFISGNTLEGLRLRTGGTTTVNLNSHFFLDGYMAYGLGDKKLKGDIIAEYAFDKKKLFRQEYPYHYLRAEYRYDINQIGQHYLYTNVDNVFLMFKRRPNDLLTYMQKAELSYYRECYNGLSYSAKLRHQREWATAGVPFNLIQADGSSRPVKNYTSAQLELFVRWAPNEKFYQSHNYRYPITLDAPVITLTHTMAHKGILGTDHNYNRTEIGARKRFWLSPFGYIDLYGQAGKVWDRVPYPLLLIPNANLSYSIQPETFPLMDPMEFIHDRFVSWEATYFLNGWLLNRLPLIKELQLREVISFRGWYGDLSDKNNPNIDGAGLYRLPANTHIMGERPYMEFGVGVENIFKIIRLDYIWRLSYREHAGVPGKGLRLALKFSF